MPQVIVVGSGPAGLAAAEALLDHGPPDLAVRLCTLGHWLGGKACSWTTDDGRTLEHGQHVVLGFYRQMRSLLRRAGVDLDTTSVSGHGRYLVFEERDQQTHRLHLAPGSLHTLVDGLAYTGWSGTEKAGFAAFFARAMAEVLARGVTERWDDECFTAWCLQRGLPPRLFETALLRASRDAQLNWPGEASAYAMLKAIVAAGRDYETAEARFPAGGMSAIWWEPVAARIQALGGTVERLRKLVGIAHGPAGIEGLAFERPIPHPPGVRYVDGPIPTDPASRELLAADAVVLTLPPPALQEVVARDPVLTATPPLSVLGRLTTVAPLGLHVWHRNAVHPRHRTVAMGLPPPLGYVVDNKPNYPEYRDDPRFGACLHFVGQETCFEDWTDEALLERALWGARRLDGFEGLDRAGVIDFAVVRNRAPHKRYWNTEPGSLAFKPEPRTPVPGLYLAGDWVRSELDFPCMENAVRSGRQAARLLLHDLRKRRRRVASVPLALLLPLLLVLACAGTALRAVPPGAEVDLPADHAPHRWAQTEWWHLHAELVEPTTGEHLGLFAAFLEERTRRDRVALLPVPVGPVRLAWVQIRSEDRTWKADRIALPDLWAADSRGPADPDAARVLDLHHGDWRLRWEGGVALLSVSAGPQQLELRFEPTRSATLPGDRGRVELVPGAAHQWVQDEGMVVRGRWQRGRQVRWLEGEGFYKHQWGRLYDDELDGFTWISMALPDQGELAVAWLHDDGMSGVPGSLAWLRSAGGEVVAIPTAKLKLTPLRSWHSRRSGADWPVAWRVEGPDLTLVVEAEVDDQELWAAPAPIWAGGARASGEVQGRPVEVAAFLEQTGARVSPLRALLRSDPPPQRGSATDTPAVRSRP